MILYIQDENYHFDGFLSGVIVDNQRTAIFKKEGIDLTSVVMKQEKLIFETKTYTDLYIYDKLSRVGLISSSKIGELADLAMYHQGQKEFYIHNFSRFLV